MSSGVSKPGDGEGRFIDTVFGFVRLAGKGITKAALKLLEKADTCQGERINYHASDVLALSILAQEITNKPLGQLFYENIYLDFRKQVGLHWTLKNGGRNSTHHWYGYESKRLGSLWTVYYAADKY